MPPFSCERPSVHLLAAQLTSDTSDLFDLRYPAATYRLGRAFMECAAKVAEDEWRASFERPVLVRLPQATRLISDKGLAEFRAVTARGPKGESNIIPSLEGVSPYIFRTMRAEPGVLALCSEFTLRREESRQFCLVLKLGSPLDVTCLPAPVPAQ